MRDKVIAIVLLFIMLFNFSDVITDISLGVPSWHIVEESIIVFLSGVGAVMLFNDIRGRTAHIARLKEKLSQSDIELKNISDEMRLARANYSEVIHDQFRQWQLTKSEQQVAMLLLKGLSFKEISAVRDTKEKTVRQQASTIYAKANLEGRHEFAAWFLEDFIAGT